MTIGGYTFVYRGVDQDYCFQETIRCLQECTDEVCVVVIESEDGTLERVREVANEKTRIIEVPIEDWNNRRGREKISYYQNLAASYLTTDYNFLLQCDEILHEESYKYLRGAAWIGSEGYICERINLWESPYKRIEVEHDRNPCSPFVVRLAKKNHKSVEDGEQVAVVDFNWTQAYNIRIYHFGFVRDRDKMMVKSKHMQKEVFEIDYDKKLDLCETFNPRLWFSKEDLKPITEPLPKIMETWAKERTYPEID